LWIIATLPFGWPIKLWPFKHLSYGEYAHFTVIHTKEKSALFSAMIQKVTHPHPMFKTKKTFN